MSLGRIQADVEAQDIIETIESPHSLDVVISRGNTYSTEARSGLLRPVVRGKFLFVGETKLTIRGITYGAFRPDSSGNEFHDLAKIDSDFASMARAGFNVVRIPHTTPPRELLDIAHDHGLFVMVGLSAEQHVGQLLDHPVLARRKIEREIRERVRICAGHAALLCYALGNEIPAPIVRFVGPSRIEKFLKQMCEAVRDEDPGSLVTYVNYPTTEYLDLYFLDLLAMNVYLENEDDLTAYLARLQNIAGDRPLLLSEVGLDSLRNGEDTQATALAWQIRVAAEAGCVGVVIFSWTDEWYRGGEDVDDWAFGLTDGDRNPKPALDAVKAAFAASQSPLPPDPPSISVVLCSYNGSSTIPETVDALLNLDYPDYEIIVVDDGSTDDTARLADRPGVNLVRTMHSGLSSARNTGLNAATGDIVAYIDDDAYPDKHWLSNLSLTFQTTDHAGIGGPNISPTTDGPMHHCVANAPGNPSHVLIDDGEAEHIPGCNMAFRRDALLSIGGFDTQFRSAGDDVDICWRLREAGFTLGFSPTALVWHHRRGSIRAYMKQQIGYGSAERMLAQKWRNRLGGKTQVDWSGTIYGNGHTRPLRVRRPVVYHGVWGQAPFQSVYQSQPSRVSSLLLAPRFALTLVGLAAVALVGALLFPWTWIGVLPLLMALGVLGVQAISSARRAVFPHAILNQKRRFGLVATTAVLHVLQPTARLWGQLRHGPAHQSIDRNTFGYAIPVPTKRLLWTDRWIANELRLAALENELKIGGAHVRRGFPDSNWDLEVSAGRWGAARTCLASEDHKDQHQLIRVRLWPKVSSTVLSVVVSLAAVLALALNDEAYRLAWVVGSALALVAAITVFQTGSAMGVFWTPLKREGFASRVPKS